MTTHNAQKVFISMLAALVLLSMSCSFFSASSAQPAPNQQATEQEKRIATLEAMVATQQAAQLTATANPAPVQVVQSAPIQAPAAVLPMGNPTLPPAPTPDQVDDFNTWMKSARVLLYEDMIGAPNVIRFVKEALDQMGQPYVDVGSAQGRLKKYLTLGAEGGAPWDLIIISTEYRSLDHDISGEYFVEFQRWIEQGTPVVLESWYLDEVSEGKARPILKSCGVEVKNYATNDQSSIDLVLWPLAGINHPILTEPNNYLSLTKPVHFWPRSDQGSLMYLTGEGDATLLVGLKREEPNRHGTLAVCLDGKLTLQTFSSHNYPRETMDQAWKNYIYNALKVRYENTH